MLDKPNVLMLRPYSMSEIADLYGVNAKTIKRWMKSINKKVGERQGRYYNIRQFRMIVDHFGIPGCSIDLD